MITRIRGSDLDGWANLRESTDPSHWLIIIVVTGLCVHSAGSSSSSKSVLNIVDCSEVLSKRNLPHEPICFASSSHSHFSRRILELLLVITQTICRCLNIKLRCFHKVLDIFGCQFKMQVLIHFRDHFSMLEDDQRLLCKYWADWLNWWCVIKALHLTVQRWSDLSMFSFFYQYPRTNASMKLICITSAVLFDFPSGLWTFVPHTFFISTKTVKRPMSLRK